MNVERVYNVYRQETSTREYKNIDFKLIYPGCKDSTYVDIGMQPAPPQAKFPPEYTITEFSPPMNLHIFNKTHIAQMKIAKKSKNWVRVVLYQKGSREIASFHLERLVKLLKELVPPEIGFTIIVCNDDYSKILV
jgi:hypothetical protein